MDWKKEFERWQAQAAHDPFLADDMAKLTDEKSIEESFYTELEFGTAGLRGIIGAGSNRMNAYVVRRASRGLAEMILETEGESGAKRGVAIAYDSRNRSDIFAMETALTLCSCGIRVYLYSTLHSVPQLSFTVRHLNCIAGVVITASHNPPEYNGYKVYWADGAQVTPPHDTGILTEVRAVKSFAETKTIDAETAKQRDLLRIIGSEVDDAYIAEMKKLVRSPEAVAAQADKLRIVYTPLHGAGCMPVTRVLRELGFSHVFVVPEQAEPDGDFPTVSYPNPEAAEVYELALALAERERADLILATDPDSDRIGVYARDAEGTYHPLTGNVSGCLLAEYEIARLAEKNALPADGRLITTIVSGKLSRAIAAHYGTGYTEVLTGFKYIGEQIKWMEEQGSGSFLFGYEESYGCLIGDYARDKDAVSAAMALCELTAWYAEHGKTLWDAVTDLFEKYGYYAEGIHTITMKGYDGRQKMDALMERLHAAPAASIGAFPVQAVRDYLTGVHTDCASGETEKLTLPESDVIYFELENDAWCAVRPSGTEPKIKMYYGVKGTSFDEAQALEEALQKGIRELVE